MTSVLTSTRCRNPLLTRVEDFENSPEWLKLTCSINDLTKLNSPQALKNNQVNHDRSRNNVTSKLSPKNLPKPEVWAKEFEKSYFYQQEPELMSTKLISKSNSQIPSASSDKNSKKTSKEFTGKDKTFASNNIHEKSDFLFRPGSMDFRGSRERLHEIFEHNRLLRKRFFELNEFSTSETSNRLINTDKDTTLSMNQSGFGSTETLGSQSNQSGGSSTNEKSRDFENSPDIDEIVKIDKVKMYDTSTPDINPYDSSAFANNHSSGNDEEHSKIVGNSFRNSGQNSGQIASFSDDFGNCDKNVQYNQTFYSPSSDNCDAFVNGSSRAFNSFQDQSTDVATSEIADTLTKENFRYKQNDSKLQKFCVDSSDCYDFVNDVLKREERGTCEIGDTLKSPQLVSSFSNSMMDLNGEFWRIERSHLYDTLGSDAERRKSIGSSTPGNGSTLPFVYGPIPYKSPRRYVEGEVTIHYRSPVRTEAKEILSEEELARKSAENMRRVYQEERRRKYLQELHDIDSRRHTDNFTPSQKSPIPLNRYDDFIDDLSYRSRSQEHTPEPRLVARALYNFVGQTTRELSFRRGDIILIRRQIDKNWYEGEHNAMIGLFPLNYVEILPYDGSRGTPKKSYEGQARAKFNFIAQTNLELSLAKGELVVLTRRVDENWFEGRIGNKKGIFPVTYVEVILEPGQHRPETPVSSKPVASPAAHSMLSNGTASGKLSMGPHHYTPSIPVKTSTAEPQYISLPRIGVTERNKLHVAPVNETLHIDTHSDTIPYRALYNYRPQNEDELELKEGDTVYVMEKCDDGWFVGSSQRTGYFGTFPGNYVERL